MKPLEVSSGYVPFKNLYSEAPITLLNVQGPAVFIEEINSCRYFIIKSDSFDDNMKEDLLITIDGFLYQLGKYRIPSEQQHFQSWMYRDPVLHLTKMQNAASKLIHCMPFLVWENAKIGYEGKCLLGRLSRWPLNQDYINILKKNICLIIECATNKKMITENNILQQNLEATKEALLDLKGSTSGLEYHLDLAGIDMGHHAVMGYCAPSVDYYMDT